MKIITMKGCDCFTRVPNFISISEAFYELSGFETLKIRYTRTPTHTSGRQIKIKFLDVLDYSEYSDTNIRKKKKISRNHSFCSEEAKTWKNCMYRYSSMTVRWLKIYWICDTSCDRLLYVRQNRLRKSMYTVHNILCKLNWRREKCFFLSQIELRLRIMSDRSQNMNSIRVWRSKGRKATSSNEYGFSCLSEVRADITRVEVVASPCDVKNFS